MGSLRQMLSKSVVSDFRLFQKRKTVSLLKTRRMELNLRSLPACKSSWFPTGLMILKQNILPTHAIFTGS